MRVAILHYAAPPVVGGVEQTIYYHARVLARAGYQVRVLTGDGAPFDPCVEVVVVPEFGSRHPAVLRIKAQLDQGEVTADWAALRDYLRTCLSDALADVHVLIAHNILTLHKNLALTAALEQLIAEWHDRADPLSRGRPIVLAWHHDLAWDDPRYRDQLHPGSPWDLLRTPWLGVRHVTVSAAQQARLAALYAIAPERIAIVPPGVDIARWLGWTDTTRRVVAELRLLDADLLLLLPARLTRRKNVELALRIVAALRAQTRRDVRLIVTGPPGAHNPANMAYLQNLLDLRRDLGLQDAAHFLYEFDVILDEDTIAAFYRLADALLFPSTQEGFGIPVLEAGLMRVPIFCADIPSLRETGDGTAHFFDPHADPAEIAAQIVHALEHDAAHGLRRRVLSSFTWDSIVKEKVIPLLQAMVPTGARDTVSA